MDDRAAGVVRIAGAKRGDERGEDLCLGVLIGGKDGTFESLWQQSGQLQTPSISLMTFYCVNARPE